MSSVKYSSQASRSPRLKAATASRTVVSFSCDTARAVSRESLAYSRSPAASSPPSARATLPGRNGGVVVHDVVDVRKVAPGIAGQRAQVLDADHAVAVLIRCVKGGDEVGLVVDPCRQARLYTRKRQ